jgi:hypothetical protein
MSGVNCREFESALIEVARKGPLKPEERAGVAAHVEICNPCRALLRSQKRLNAAAGILAADTAQFTMPPRVERALLAEFEAARAIQRSQRRRFVYGVLGGAIAASLAMVAWVGYRPVRKISVATSPPVAAQPAQTVLAVTEPVAKNPRKRVVRPAAEPEQPFIAIPYTLPLEPWERTDVVRMEMPVAALIAAGLPMSMTDPGARARTDVLVGQDGRARAIRLISISIPN